MIGGHLGHAEETRPPLAAPLLSSSPVISPIPPYSSWRRDVTLSPRDRNRESSASRAHRSDDLNAPFFVLSKNWKTASRFACSSIYLYFIYILYIYIYIYIFLLRPCVSRWHTRAASRRPKLKDTTMTRGWYRHSIQICLIHARKVLGFIFFKCYAILLLNVSFFVGIRHWLWSIDTRKQTDIYPAGTNPNCYK